MRSMRLVSLVLLLAVAISGSLYFRHAVLSPPDPVVEGHLVSVGDDVRQLIGPVATVAESESGIEFKARVDTGATHCSIHVAEWEIESPAENMAENVGKTIRFRTENRCGRSEWLEREIAAVDLVKTSEKSEWRYLVRMNLHHNGVEREVLVSLNDRSRMSYPVLVGRNYLAGHFVVDVASSRTESLLANERR